MCPISHRSAASDFLVGLPPPGTNPAGEVPAMPDPPCAAGRSPHLASGSAKYKQRQHQAPSSLHHCHPINHGPNTGAAQHVLRQT